MIGRSQRVAFPTHLSSATGRASPRVGDLLVPLLPVAIAFEWAGLHLLGIAQLPVYHTFYFVTSVACAFDLARGARVQRGFAVAAVAWLTGASALFLNSAYLRPWETDWIRGVLWLQAMTWALLVLSSTRSAQSVSRFNLSLAGASSAVAASAWIAWVRSPTLHRVAGLIGHSDGTAFERQLSFNEAGAVHAMSVIIILAALQRKRWSPGLRLFLLASILLNVSALVLSQSRSAILGGLLGVMAYLIVNSSRRGSGTKSASIKRLASIALPVLAAVIGSGLLLTQLAINRLRDSFTAGSHVRGSAEVRVEEMSAAAWAWLEGPVSIFLGPGSSVYYSVIAGETAENYWLDRAIGGGLIWLVVAVVLFLLPVHTVHSRRDWKSPSGARVAGLMTCLGFISLTGNVLAGSAVGALWVLGLYLDDPSSHVGLRRSGS